MIINPASRLQVVKEYYFSLKLKEIAKMNVDGEAVINLGIGSPDLPPKSEVIETLCKESIATNVHAYQSYQGLPALREAFAEWYKREYEVNLNPNEEVLPLMGSKEGIMHISMSFLEKGDQVLVPNPGYPAYAATAKLAGAEIVYYDLLEANHWLIDLDELAKKDLSKIKVMWVNYPHMPTGTKASKAFLQELVEFGRQHKILICNDNPYSFVLNEFPLSILSIKGAKEVCLELNSLSKSHHMAGWRIGMIAGAKDYLQTILKFKSNMDSGMFKPLQLAAVKALGEDQVWREKTNQTYAERREVVYEILEKLDCTFSKNQAGLFVWARIPKTEKSGFEMSDQILKNCRVFICPGGIFGSNGDPYIRISLCNPINVFQKAKAKIANYVIKNTVHESRS